MKKLISETWINLSNGFKTSWNLLEWLPYSDWTKLNGLESRIKIRASFGIVELKIWLWEFYGIYFIFFRIIFVWICGAIEANLLLEMEVLLMYASDEWRSREKNWEGMVLFGYKKEVLNMLSCMNRSQNKSLTLSLHLHSYNGLDPTSPMVKIGSTMNLGKETKF